MKDPRFVVRNPKMHGGQAMLLSILIMSGMMAVAMVVSTVFITELRLARQTPDSVKAFYAADTGAECLLYNYIRTPMCGLICSGNMTESEVSFYADISCAPATSTKSIGTSRGVRRALEVFVPF